MIARILIVGIAVYSLTSCYSLTPEEARNSSVESLCFTTTANWGRDGLTKEEREGARSELKARGVASCDPVGIDTYYCSVYGYEKGTPNYGACMIVMNQVRAQNHLSQQAMQQAQSAALMQIGNQMMNQSQPQSTITNTNCSRLGNTVNCTSTK
jgi:hypothetical protein